MAYQFIGFGFYCVINQIGQNLYPTLNGGEWNGTLISTIYTVASVVAIVLQFAFGKYVANSGHLKGISILLLALAALSTVGMATLHASEVVWLIMWGLAVFTSIVGATFVVSTMVGQWFPRRKGTVMGIATLAFPVINGIVMNVFGAMLGASGGNQLLCWLPWIAMDVIGILICIFFLKEYPEQCGAYPDNDKSITPEMSKKMLEEQMEAKKRSVWNIKNTFKTPGFWLTTIPIGVLLLGSVGAMTQVMPLLSQFDGFIIGGVAPTAKGTLALLLFAAIGAAGSWIIGLLDSKFGTKKAILLSCALMCISSVLCAFGTATLFLIGFGFLQLFLGAASNFTVSVAAQYWRREDFPSAYSFINPLANLICAFGPFLIVILRAATGSYTLVWIVMAALGLISVIFMLIFKPASMIARDKKYRVEAGLPEEGFTKSNAEITGEK